MATYLLCELKKSAKRNAIENYRQVNNVNVEDMSDDEIAHELDNTSTQFDMYGNEVDVIDTFTGFSALGFKDFRW